MNCKGLIVVGDANGKNTLPESESRLKVCQLKIVKGRSTCKSDTSFWILRIFKQAYSRGSTTPGAFIVNFQEV